MTTPNKQEKCCGLCRPNTLEKENGLDTCRQTMCGCHFNHPKEENKMEGWVERFDKDFNWFKDVKISPREAGDYKQAEIMQKYYRNTGEKLKDFIRTQLTLAHSSGYEKGFRDGEGYANDMEISGESEIKRPHLTE